MTDTKLQQIFEVYPPQSHATIPLGIRVNDMVFAGGIAGIDRVTSEPAGDLKGQMTAALGHLRDLLERAGGSLDNVVRATGFVTRAEDRDPIYDPWDTLFPDPADRPAFKSLIAPLPPGQLVQLDAVALIGERRGRIDIPNVPARDPTVKAGNWLFSSRCHGNDQTTGQIVEGGLEAETRQTLENLATLTRLAGASEANIRQITMFGRDTAYMAAARGVFEERFPDPEQRPHLNQLVNFVSGRHAIAIEMVAEVGERFREIYLCPEHDSHSAGVQLGPLLFAPGLASVDPCTGELRGDGLEAQLRGAFANMELFLKAGGAGREHVARVTVFMTDLAERQLLNGVWSELYPDPNDRPPHKYVPTTLPDGQLVAVQVLALPGAVRRVLTVPGLVHQDPMSMGALTANLVTSSRIFAGRRVESEDEHLSMLVESAATMLGQAGGSLGNLVQVTAFIGDAQYRAGVEKALGGLQGQGGEAPQLHVLEVDLGGGSGVARIEILGLA